MHMRLPTSSIEARCIICLLLIPLAALSQPPQEQWRANFGGEGDDVPSAVCETPDGSLLVAGSTTSFDGIGRDIYLVKLDQQGGTVWQRVYDFGLNEAATDIDVVDDTTYTVVGHQQEGGLYWERVILSMRINADGDTLSTRIYNYRPGQFPLNVCPNNSGLIILGAAINVNDYGWYALGVNTPGDTLWSMLGLGNSGFPVSVTGYFSDADYHTELGSVAICAHGGVGWDPNGGTYPIRSMRMMRFDTIGNILWTHIGPEAVLGSTMANRVALQVEGSVIWMIRHSYGGSRFDCFNFDGDSTRSVSIADSVIDLARGVHGGWVTISQVWGWDRDIRFSGYDSLGNLVFNTVVDAEENQTPIRIEQVSDSGYVILGTIDYASGLRNMCVIKTEPVLSLDASRDHPSMPTGIKLFQNYPNPFNSSTQIRFDLPVAANVKLTVFDLLGRKITVLADEAMAAGTHNRSFDATVLPSGIFFCRLQAGDQAQIQKLVLLR